MCWKSQLQPLPYSITYKTNICFFVMYALLMYMHVIAHNIIVISYYIEISLATLYMPCICLSVPRRVLSVFGPRLTCHETTYVH